VKFFIKMLDSRKRIVDVACETDESKDSVHCEIGQEGRERENACQKMVHARQESGEGQIIFMRAYTSLSNFWAKTRKMEKKNRPRQLLRGRWIRRGLSGPSRLPVSIVLLGLLLLRC
jgi:hypothetical protein